ncbi:MAG: flippase-like domain-containing protein [Alphaproteobacteria bacterium]|nr:flippase-like domain-containing protein [Alphaproteobacteria bacterium]
MSISLQGWSGWSQLLLRAAVTAVLFIAIFNWTGPNLSWELLRGIDSSLLAAAFSLQLIQFPLAGLRWHLAMGSVRSALPYGAALRHLLLSIFASQALPGTVGGDVLRITMAARRLGLSAATQSVVVDRLAALIVLCLLLLVFGYGHAQIPSEIVWAGTAFVAAAMIGCGVLALLLARTRYATSFARLRRHVEEIRWLWLPRWETAAIYLLGATLHLMTCAIVWLLAAGLGIHQPLGIVVVVTLCVMLASALPISLGGWGVREGAMVAGLGLAAVPADQALALALAWGIMSLAGGMAAGLAWLASGPRGRDTQTDNDAPTKAAT